MNSFPGAIYQRTIGTRLSGHFLTHIVARFPRAAIPHWTPNKHLRIAALYLAGRDDFNSKKLQYHIQITAINAPNGAADAVDAARECPDYAAAATPQQLAGSEEFVVFVCATLGEFDEGNRENYIKIPPDAAGPSRQVLVQYDLGPAENSLWDRMDAATFKAIEEMCAANHWRNLRMVYGLRADAQPEVSRHFKPKRARRKAMRERDVAEVAIIEYWFDDLEKRDGSGTWKKDPSQPGKALRRIPGVVHEACSCWMEDGETAASPVGPDYRPRGVDNVYVTGSAIFPSAGSWNPTLTMVGFAQDLAMRHFPPRQQ